jgi:hypothetical protein
MRQSQIAAVIERDLMSAADNGTKTDVVACRSCGHTFRYRGRRGDLNGNFCSARCQDWFDDGNPSYEEQRERQRKLENAPLRGFTVIAGPPGTIGTNPWQSIVDARNSVGDMRPGVHGFYIRCAGCQKDFESRGLRCCSTACERRYCERQENLRVMAEVGIEPSAKRKCEAEGCGRPIPKWRNGRRVSSATRFCSAKCRQRAHSQNRVS